MSRRGFIIANRLGEAKAAQLSALVGGTRIAVPANLSNGDRLKRRIGDDLAILVILHFGGTSSLYVPVLERATVVEIEKVRRLAKSGHSAAAIARKLRCSERTITAKLATIRSRKLLNGNKSGEESGSAS